MFELLETIDVNSALYVFGMSMLPIVELRGGIPLGATLGLPWVSNYIICVLGNMLPVPFILLFVKAVFQWLKKINKIRPMIEKLEKRIMSKKGQIEKYELLGLMLFVAIPLPGTGAWTGSAIAAFLHMDNLKSFLVTLAGVLIAGLVMSGISYGFISFLDFLK